MQIPKDAMLLRIFCGEDDKFERQPLYEAIVLKARKCTWGEQRFSEVRSATAIPAVCIRPIFGGGHRRCPIGANHTRIIEAKLPLLARWDQKLLLDTSAKQHKTDLS
jgi:PII-like signaling protein